MNSHCWGSALHVFEADEFSAALVPKAIYNGTACLIIVCTPCMVCIVPHREINQGQEADVLFHCTESWRLEFCHTKAEVLVTLP